MNMKSEFKFLVLLAAFAFALGGCTQVEADQNTTVSSDQPAAESNANSAPAPTKVSYEADWNAFKIAVADHDVERMNAFMKIEGVDGQHILEMMPPEAHAAMEKTTYSELKDEEWEGKKVKEFLYEESSMDEDGNEMGMALFYYFEEQAEGLRMVGYLAAG